jgi:hypothetical protein
MIAGISLCRGSLNSGALSGLFLVALLLFLQACLRSVVCCLATHQSITRLARFGSELAEVMEHCNDCHSKVFTGQLMAPAWLSLHRLSIGCQVLFEIHLRSFSSSLDDVES